MDFYNILLKLLNKIYRDCGFVQMLINAVAHYINIVYQKIMFVRSVFYFDELDLEGCKYWEELLDIKPRQNQTIAERQSQIQAKWYSNIHSDIELIQLVCDAWKNGEVIADFIDGKIRLTFVGEIGIPTDLQALYEAIDRTKPAHLPYESLFRYLLIRDIHEVKTLTQMETLTLRQFARGIE